MATLQMVPKVGEETQHPSHPQHPLKLVFAPYLYTCSGCKEYGTGLRYRCSKCGFHMHEFCTKAPTTTSHPYHAQHELYFQNKPVGLKKSKCEVCARATNGFVYRCPTCSFCIHPCCSQLPSELTFKEHPQHPLKLLSVVADNSPYTCNACNKQGTTWKQGISAPPKLSKIGRAARYASQIVQIFVDGLLEGIGETVGDLILDTITRAMVLPITDGDGKHGLF
ncbi:hypothetical protein SUGI_0429830 [Cryptomeria japonica]|nr:hypothetical protein SUGI_0429830 [Cryptomeria japonica]